MNSIKTQLQGIGLGSFRFVLALFVALSHLWAGMPHGFAAYAVWGFFALSGFLMCAILLDKYGLSASGLRAYAFNRFLRIFPAYYAASVLGIIVVVWATRNGVDLKALNPEFGLPSSLGAWLFPVTLLPVFGREAMPIAVANALGIEVGFYLLMPLMAWRRWVAWLFLLLGVALIAHHGIEPKSFGERYATFWPCVFAFSIGALAAHYRHELRKLTSAALASVAWLANSLVWFRIGWWPWTIGLYVATVFSAWLVVSLADRKQSTLDRWLGDLSYPLYLLHTIAGGVFMVLMGSNRSLTFCAFSLVLTLVVSALFVRLIDHPLQRRKRPAVLKV